MGKKEKMMKIGVSFQKLKKKNTQNPLKLQMTENWNFGL